jgi:hypothetical protein
MHYSIYPRFSSPAENEAPLQPFDKTPGYWDFINQVRNDWGVNFTIPGCWGGTDKGKRKAYWENLPWFRSNGVFQSKGYEMPREAYKSYYENRMTNKELKYIPGLELWELFLNEKETSKFKDSIMTDETGKLRTCYNDWLSQKQKTEGYHIYTGIFAKGNALYKKRMEQIRFLINDVGTDGIYVDCFNYLVRYSYSSWDGHTVNINPETLTIKKKYSDMSLVTTPAKEELVKYIHSQKKDIVGNTLPVTRAMNNVKMVRFIEMWHNYSIECPKTHLYTPVGLGYPGYNANLGLDRGVVTADWFIDDLKGALDSGCLYYYRSMCRQDKDIHAYSIVDHMYPFTPIGIYNGWLWGKERIITTKSGSYGWHDMSTVKGYLFDKTGKALPFPFKTIKVGNEHITKIKLDSGQIAILERK